MPMPANFTQCLFCGTSILETEGFDPKVWMKTHVKTCIGTEVKEEKVIKGKKKSREASSPSFATEVTSRVGEVLAKEFIKQLFKK